MLNCINKMYSLSYVIINWKLEVVMIITISLLPKFYYNLIQNKNIIYSNQTIISITLIIDQDKRRLHTLSHSHRGPETNSDKVRPLIKLS